MPVARRDAIHATLQAMGDDTMAERPAKVGKDTPRDVSTEDMSAIPGAASTTTDARLEAAVERALKDLHDEPNPGSEPGAPRSA